MIVSVKLESKSRQYDILIKEGIFADLPQLLLEKHKGSKISIVTDSNVVALYGDALEQGLKKLGLQTFVTVLKAGEQSKNMKNVLFLFEQWSLQDMTRGDIIIALGGGVIGDICGFAAATYLRGVSYYQVPTTLLAQVDSSVGGKTAVDLPSGKNRAGAFYQPKGVFIDTNVLHTLPKRQFACGMAEVIKYAAIFSEELFVELENNNKNKVSEKIISKCCMLKRDIVEKDELDTGERMLLNFGHTIGHAIEKQYQYKKYTHGEAVAAGMCLITAAFEKAGFTEKGTSERLKALVKSYHLPTELPISKTQLLDDISSDKKRDKQNINVVILERVGVSKILSLSVSELVRLINEA